MISCYRTSSEYKTIHVETRRARIRAHTRRNTYTCFFRPWLTCFSPGFLDPDSRRGSGYSPRLTHPLSVATSQRVRVCLQWRVETAEGLLLPQEAARVAVAEFRNRGPVELGYSPVWMVLRTPTRLSRRSSREPDRHCGNPRGLEQCKIPQLPYYSDRGVSLPLLQKSNTPLFWLQSKFCSTKSSASHEWRAF